MSTSPQQRNHIRLVPLSDASRPADDDLLLLSRALRLRDRLHTLYEEDPLVLLQRSHGSDGERSIETLAAEATNSEIIDLYELHQRAIHSAQREYRHILQQLARVNNKTAPDSLEQADHADQADQT